MGHRSLSDVALIAHVEQALDMPSAYSGSFGREERLGLNLSANSVTKYCQAITGQIFPDGGHREATFTRSIN
jgi:hypothetical protein